MPLCIWGHNVRDRTRMSDLECHIYSSTLYPGGLSMDVAARKYTPGYISVVYYLVPLHVPTRLPRHRGVAPTLHSEFVGSDIRRVGRTPYGISVGYQFYNRYVHSIV